MFEVGRVCVKIAGRDAGKKCVIIELVDEKTVLIDGETRRRKCNVMHLEVLDQVLKIGKNAPHGEILAEGKKLGWDVKETKAKAKTVRPRRVRKTKAKPVEEKKVEKKAVAPKTEVKKTVKKAEKKE